MAERGPPSSRAVGIGVVFDAGASQGICLGRTLSRRIAPTSPTRGGGERSGGGEVAFQLGYLDWCLSDDQNVGGCAHEGEGPTLASGLLRRHLRLWKATAAGGSGITAGGREASYGAEANPGEDQSSSNTRSNNVSRKSLRTVPFEVGC